MSGLFLGIGHEPNARCSRARSISTAKATSTLSNNVFTTRNGVVVPGVYACGDVQDRRYRQAITAAGTGCMAALEAEKFLEEHGR